MMTKRMHGILCVGLIGAVAGVSIGHAQTTPQSDPLNQDCVISILNRTVQVSERGEWVLPNVPSTQGQIRARATCVRNGETVAGQSDYFTVLNNGVVTVPNIKFGSLDDIPQSLSLGATSTTLNGGGNTLQLSVQALYSDSTTKDVSSVSSGINYSSSNPAIATITPNGLVTAVSSGNALITARKDGASTMIVINVVTSGDSDGDGIPDDYELAHGLNPNDPTDAAEDQDGDGLSALREYQLGTDPRNADTDGDGISDGEEVTPGADGYITNPLLSDTDGDGLPDGVEVTVGSNPTNPTSANYAAALTGISVSPGRPVIVYNTIDSESSIKLVVTGTLINGASIDLTSKSRGTSYISSDLTVASFGLEDGRVFAGQDGVAQVVVTNAGHIATSYITVETYNPSPVSHLTIPGTANEVDVDGNSAYIAAGSAGLVVVNITDPTSPSIVRTVSTGGNSLGIRVKNNRAYIADGPVGIKIYDITT